MAQPANKGDQTTYVYHSNAAFATLNMVLAITASLGNILILLGLRKPSSLYPASKVWYRSLALADLCIGVAVQPAYAAQLIKLNTWHRQHWDNHSPFVVYIHVTSGIMCGISLGTLTALSVDRLLALLLKMKYKKIVTVPRVRVLVVFLWLSIIGFELLFLSHRSTFHYLSACLLGAALLASTMCYLKIILSLRYRQLKVKRSLFQGRRNQCFQINMARYKKTVSNALCVHIALVACYLPYAIVRLLWLIRFQHPYLIVAQNMATSLIYLNSSLNPVLYCWRIREVRWAVKKMIRQSFCRQFEC